MPRHCRRLTPPPSPSPPATAALTQVTCYGPPPSPRRDATLVSAEDGRRLWVFGGFEGTRCLNDVYMLEMERLTWSYVNINSAPPEPRMCHSATAIGQYMLISGGHTVNSKGEKRGLYDTQVGAGGAPEAAARTYIQN